LGNFFSPTNLVTLPRQKKKVFSVLLLSEAQTEGHRATILVAFYLLCVLGAGLPDFSWHNLPKR
jgi:hypothetical protein